MSLVYGAECDPERTVTTHLFVICPNNSGSTFLKQALATCRDTWNLSLEGQFMLGYAGPTARSYLALGRRLLWASTPRLVDRLSDAGAFDWARIRKAWYFQSFARRAEASVFVEKSPQHLLLVDELAANFANARFLFMVRNPYAACEGVCRYEQARQRVPDPDLPAQAARHVVRCLEVQRRNIAAHRSDGVFVRYEDMCAEPERIAAEIRALVPELDDLNLRRRLPVKGLYDEMLTDMNARQIARLTPERIAAFNRVFRDHRDVLAHFGYELLGENEAAG